jgi:hypothetical protein
MKLKEISTMFFLCLTIAISSISMNVQAYEYVEEYDVNMDYSVNVRDVVYISRALTGKIIATNPEFLDVNGNGIADEVDMKIILYYISGKNVYYNQQ